MAKPRTIYACSNPEGPPGHYTSGKFFTECPECGFIGMPDEKVATEDKTPQLSKVSAAIAATGTVHSEFRDLGDVVPGEYSHEPTGIEEWDRVMGGGFVPGSYVMLAAEPGAGKSTLSNQIIDQMLKRGRKVGLVLGEESELQVRYRFDRIDLESKGVRYITTEHNLDQIVPMIVAEGLDFIVVDSIQTVRRSDISGEAGQISQVNACSALLQNLAKQHGVTILLIGHSTKSNSVAGPQTLKHLVDVVVTMEGEERTHYRFLRALKNRFGSTEEVGILAMDDDGKGLVSVADGSLMFISTREEPVIGSVVCPVLEGSRVVLVEVQALVNPSSMGNPTRIPDGISKARMQLLMAVLERHCGLELSSYDAYLRLADGLKVDDPGLDLAICLALASAYQNVAMSVDSVAYGEVSLVGEVRPALGASKREREATRRNLTRIIGGSSVKTLQEALLKAGLTA
jgi:DNA repair protein RadA/Sms